MTKVRRVGLALATAVILATATVVPALAAQPPFATLCRLSGTGDLIDGILVPDHVWNDVLFPNRDTNGFLYAGAACST